MRAELITAAELLSSSKLGDFDRAVALMQNTVMSFTMKVCGHREDAEDTMQEVFVSSLPHLRKIRDPRALAVWLYKTARTRCWMSKRRSKFAPKDTLSLDALMPDDRELESLVANREESPEAEVSNAQQADQVRQAVLRIPPKYRLILVLHDMEDLETAEVAAITGLAEGTVRVRLHRARLFVRKELGAASRPKSRKKKVAKPLSCRQMFAGLSELLDGRLDDLTCDRVNRHLRDCPPCVAFLQDLRRAVERCRQAESPCNSATADKVRKLLVQEYLRLSEEATMASS